MELVGRQGSTGPLFLDNDKANFQRGRADVFQARLLPCILCMHRIACLPQADCLSPRLCLCTSAKPLH